MRIFSSQPYNCRTIQEVERRMSPPKNCHRSQLVDGRSVVPNIIFPFPFKADAYFGFLFCYLFIMLFSLCWTWHVILNFILLKEAFEPHTLNLKRRKKNMKLYKKFKFILYIKVFSLI